MKKPLRHSLTSRFLIVLTGALVSLFHFDSSAATPRCSDLFSDTTLSSTSKPSGWGASFAFALSRFFGSSQAQSQAPVETLAQNRTQSRTQNESQTQFQDSTGDDYLWLEDTESEKTREWVRKQTGETINYLRKHQRLRQNLHERFLDLLVETDEQILVDRSQFKIALRTIARSRTDYFAQSSLYLIDKWTGERILILDPTLEDPRGHLAIDTIRVSPEGTKIAIYLSRNGSDLKEIRFYDINNRVWLTGPNGTLSDGLLENASSSSPIWVSEQEFIYTSFGEGSERSLRLYSLGKGPNQEAVFPAWFRGELSSNSAWYVGSRGMIKISELTKVIHEQIDNRGRWRNAEQVNAELKKAWIQFPPHSFDSIPEYIGTIDNFHYYIHSDEIFGSRELARLPVENPSAWQVVVPHDDERVLHDVYLSGGKVFVQYLKNVAAQFVAYEPDGRLIETLPVPERHFVSGVSRGGSGKIRYTTQGYTGTNHFEFDPASGSYRLIEKVAAPYKTEIEERQVLFTASDGRQISMYMVGPKGFQLDGDNPVLLWGYGGFGMSILPSPRDFIVPFVENGGIYADVQLRGGMEYGPIGYREGSLRSKQRVFDDMKEAAEHLVQQGYTRPGKLAVSGGSNGGLMAAAVAVQNPELFQLSIPMVGVLDMLRKDILDERAHGWIFEYGSATDPRMMNYLAGYSPLFQAQPGRYPFFYVVTGTHDTRVNPAHSYKFAVALKDAQQGESPILLHAWPNVGHSMLGYPLTMKIASMRDFWSVVFIALGMDFKNQDN